MNASFGIDHPLLATPWGTNTSLAMFNGCLLEIMGIYDSARIDQVPAGDFRFGRHIYEHLLQREGVALTALHSTDSHKDAKFASTKGLTVAGHLEFGRDVKLPNGIVANEVHQAVLYKRFTALYGKATPLEGGFECQTANGIIRVLNASAYQLLVGVLSENIFAETLPCVAGMDFNMKDPSKFVRFLGSSAMGYKKISDGYALTEPQATANTTLRFISV